jgi:glycosyltransferase involved in cell wall biosynthesis
MKQPTVSIILTIHNQEDLIKRVVNSILENKSKNVKELIMIFDACTDKSKEYAEKLLKDTNDISLIFNETTEDFYEIKCNNIGLKLSSCNYSMIVQDDMVIEEKDFDTRMLKPFMFEDTFAVTSRISHNYLYVDKKLLWVDYAGYDPYNLKLFPIPRNVFAIRDTCNRGPLLLDNEKVEKLNYLDESYWPQNLDDHDICLRAWTKYGWTSGSYWIKWTSREEWGGTRKNQEKYLWFEEFNALNKERLFKNHYDYIISEKKHNENRYIL